MGKTELLELNQIVVGENVRSKYEKAGISELADSIREKGLLNAVLVRPFGKNQYELIFGFRRYFAHELLAKTKTNGFHKIKCNIEEVKDEDILTYQIIENLQREDPSPMDECNAFVKLMKEQKKTLEDIAKIVGKSIPYVAIRMQLRYLTKKAGAHLQKDKTFLPVALELCKLTEELQKQMVEHHNLESITKADVIEFASKYLKVAISKAPFPIDDAKLHPGKVKMGCIACPKRTGFNKALFPELAKQDLCMDTDCALGKLMAYTKNMVLGVQKNEKCFVCTDIGPNIYGSFEQLVNEVVSWTGSKVYSLGQWVPAKEHKGLDVHKGILLTQNWIKGFKIIEFVTQEQVTNKKKKIKELKSGEQNELVSSDDTEVKKTPDQRYNRKIELISQPERKQLIISTSDQLYKMENLPQAVNPYTIILLNAIKRTPYHLMQQVEEMVKKTLGIKKLDHESIHTIESKPTQFMACLYYISYVNLYEMGKDMEFCEMNTTLLHSAKAYVDVAAIEKNLDKEYDSQRESQKKRFVDRNKRSPKITKEDGYVEVKLFK